MLRQRDNKYKITYTASAVGASKGLVSRRAWDANLKCLRGFEWHSFKSKHFTNMTNLATKRDGCSVRFVIVDEAVLLESYVCSTVADSMTVNRIAGSCD